MFETYKTSGRFGPMTIVGFLIGLALVAGLAYVYQLGLYWIPFIYLSFLMTAAFGIGITMIGTWIVTAGHCRNISIAVLFSVILVGGGIAAKHYFQYRALISDLADSIIDDVVNAGEIGRQEAEARRGELMDDLFADVSYIEHFQARADMGLAIGRAGNNGAPITGIGMYIIWLIEAGMVFYFGARAPIAAAGEPYSEKMGQWADEVDEVMTLPITSGEMVSQIKSASSVEELLEIPIPKTDESHQFAVYNVNSVPGEEMEDAYLSVNLLTLSVNKEGEVQSDVKPLVKHAILSSERRKQLVENAELLNEAMEDYRNAVAEEEAAVEDLIDEGPVDSDPADD